jgi:hypothetical protein
MPPRRSRPLGDQEKRPDQKAQRASVAVDHTHIQPLHLILPGGYCCRSDGCGQWDVRMSGAGPLWRTAVGGLTGGGDRSPDRPAAAAGNHAVRAVRPVDGPPRTGATRSDPGPRPTGGRQERYRAARHQLQDAVNAYVDDEPATALSTLFSSTSDVGGVRDRVPEHGHRQRRRRRGRRPVRRATADDTETSFRAEVSRRDPRRAAVHQSEQAAQRRRRRPRQRSPP